MTKDKFVKCINLSQSFEEACDKLSKLGVDLYEIEGVSKLLILVENLWQEVLDKEGYDNLSWWLYENGRKIWDENDNPINVDTPEQLWENLLYDYQRNKEYEG